MTFNWYKRFESAAQINGNIWELLVGKRIFHIPKRLNGITVVDVEISIKCSIDKIFFNYFIGYLNGFNGGIKPFFISLLLLNRSIKSFEKVKYMSFIMLMENMIY